MATDWLSDTHVAATPESHVSLLGNVSQEEPEEAGSRKLLWRQCSQCKSLGDGFRLACLSFGQKVCRICLREAQESAERLRFKMSSGEVEKQADALLRKAGVKLTWKRGGKQIKIP